MREEYISKLEHYIGLDPTDIEIGVPKKECDDWKIVARIDSGYAFRRMVEMISETISEGIFSFTKNRISIFQTDSTYRIFVSVNIFANRLTQYVFPEGYNKINVGFSFDELKKNCNSVTKKKSIILEIYPEKATMRIEGGGDTHNFRLNIIPIEPKFYDLKSMFKRGDDYPNVTCLGSYFSETLSNANKNKVQTNIYCYHDGIELCPEEETGWMPIGTCQRPIHVDGISPICIHDPGSSGEIERKKYRNVTRKMVMHKPMLKSLGKLKPICAGGTVRIYIEHKSPLKICTELDKMGEIELIIRDETC